MPKTGRNDPCPCASGKKYKHCCLDKDRAAEFAPLAAKRAELQAQRQQHREQLNDLWVNVPDEYDNLDDDSNAVVDLIHAGRLDEAERAARELLVRYPLVIDGFDRLGMLHEARGQNRQAADCYRKLLEMVLANPDDYDPEYPALWRDRIAKLDPPNSAQ
ncbi:MAG: SEC-C domain-containing protein [Burkholderiaceae bacterium]|nr:SEC-C domain-containing protein [Burkholderiaceae bacterium]